MTALPVITSPLLDVAGARHGFFTRHGGVSEGIYASLNVGLGSRDDPDAVRENRAIDANVALTLADEVRADELPGRAFEDFDDLALGLLIRPARLAAQAHEDDVAGGRVADGLGGDEDVGELHESLSTIRCVAASMVDHSPVDRSSSSKRNEGS